MNAETLRAISELGRRLQRIESAIPAELRPGLGGSGSGTSLRVTNVTALPAIPTSGLKIVRLASDTVYWSVPGDTHWHPLGGHFALTNGTVGAHT